MAKKHRRNNALFSNNEPQSQIALSTDNAIDSNLTTDTSKNTTHFEDDSADTELIHKLELEQTRLTIEIENYQNLIDDYTAQISALNEKQQSLQNMMKLKDEKLATLQKELDTSYQTISTLTYKLAVKEQEPVKNTASNQTVPNVAPRQKYQIQSQRHVNPRLKKKYINNGYVNWN